MTEALDQLRSSLRDDQPDDIAIFEAGMAFLGVGRELIRTRESPHSPAEVDFGLQIARLAAYRQARSLERARRVAKEATAKCLAELRKEQLGAEQAPAAARELAAFIAIEDGLERCGKLVLDERAKGTPSHVA